MSKSSTLKTSEKQRLRAKNRSREIDEYPGFTQSDLDRSVFRVGLKPAARKQRITILLDTGVVEYFKAKAGTSGYQSLINDALRRAKERESLEATVRRVVREELRRK